MNYLDSRDHKNKPDLADNIELDYIGEPNNHYSSKTSSNNNMTGTEFDANTVDDNSSLIGENLADMYPAQTSRDEFQIISFMCQVFFSILLSGIGMVLSGFVLLQAKKLPQFIPEMVMILPTLMGLKGNLEMTLASRISTEVNLGHLNDKIASMQAVTANLVLVQVQAVVVSFVASFVCVILAYMSNNTVGFKQMIIVLSSSCSTASVAGLMTGLIICGIILLSHFYNFNPDNLATPLAAGLGDLTTLLVLIGACSFYTWAFDAARWIIAVIMTAHCILFIPMLVYSYHNSWSRPTLIHGWTPIFSAMLISNCTGWILEHASSRYKNLVLFLVVMNGTGGNIVSVQASRLCTKLGKINQMLAIADEQRLQTISAYLSVQVAQKQRCKKDRLRILRSSYNEDVNQFKRLLWGTSSEAKAARILILIVIPSHIALLTVSWLFPHGRFHFTFIFVVIYLVAALIQVSLLLMLAGYIAVTTWRRGHDPDNVCVPFLTALADLFGTLSLWAMVLSCLIEPEKYSIHRYFYQHNSSYMNRESKENANRMYTVILIEYFSFCKCVLKSFRYFRYPLFVIVNGFTF
ncbi:hypothetical protein GJ496_011015 [Pomphorhynchus laevis]|nr:hypothetical protein GJ496_011015 [Pomphorhynchus laevis]